MGGERVLLGWSGAPGHTKGGHPECAERGFAIEKVVRGSGLLDKGLVRELPLLEVREEKVAETISRVHPVGFLRGMKNLETHIPSEGGVLQLDRDTYATSTSYGDLLKSVSVATRLVDEVMSSDDGLSGFGLVRPPGHHSIPTSPMGFCIFNTISCAVRHAQHAHGLRRICVYDFDVHHGNGTQDIFFDDPDVLYVSTHQEGSFPGTGKLHETGEEGTTVNIPLPPGSGEEAVRMAWESVIESRIRAHQPEMLFVSAGYDAHWKDPQAGLQFQSSTFHFLSRALKHLAEDIPSCKGRCVFVLEGGYDLQALPDSVTESLRGLCEMESNPLFDTDALYEEPVGRIEDAIEAAVSTHNTK